MDDANKNSTEGGADQDPATAEPAGASNETQRTEVEPTNSPIETIPQPMVAEEVEPATVAFQTEQTPAAEQDASIPASLSEDPTTDNQPVVTPPPVGAPAVKTGDKKRLVIYAVVALLVIAVGLAAWWILAGSKETEPLNDSLDSLSLTEQPKLGVTLTVVDGTVEYGEDRESWQAASTDTQISEGYSIRTGADSRAVLTLDDGSAIRLDESTTARIASLVADDVKIEQIKGNVYSRVVPSDREYTVAIGDTTYKALGTAFITTASNDESGVQVYQSSVKVSSANNAISEGNQYYEKNSDPALEGKSTPIPIDKLIDNVFVNWNIEQDKNDASFKDKLGILPQIELRGQALEKERQLEEVRRIQQEKDAAEKRKKEQEAKRRADASSKLERGEMALSRTSNGTLKWSYSGKAVYGYKLVYSKKTEEPIFGARSSDAIYYSSIQETSGKLPSKHKIGRGKFYVRVCAYTANTQHEPCVDYSNLVVVTYD